MPNYVIEAHSLTRKFGTITAVDHLNLEIEAGAIFGLLGPDGAGKTTTVRLFSALLNPTDGYALVGGFDTARHGEKIKKIIGYMPQRFSLYGDLTVEENLRFFADVFGVRGNERRKRIEQLLEFARLTDFRRRRAAHLSGGMQKKLALACTLVHKPGILFLDEPTTGVDPISRREFWDILSDLHLQGVTLFITTPYMDEAERCSLVGLMFEGRSIVCARPDRIKMMVPGELIEIRPMPKGESVAACLRRAREVAEKFPGALDVQAYGDLLRVFVEDAKQEMPRLAEYLRSQGVEVKRMRVTRPRMEEAFISLIQERVTQHQQRG